MKKDKEIDKRLLELEKEFTKESSLPFEKTGIDKYLCSVRKKPKKAKVIELLLSYAEGETVLGVKGMKLVDVEKKLGVDRFFLRAVITRLHELGILIVMDNPYLHNLMKKTNHKIKKIIVKGKSEQYDYFKEEIKKINP